MQLLPRDTEECLGKISIFTTPTTLEGMEQDYDDPEESTLEKMDYEIENAELKRCGEATTSSIQRHQVCCCLVPMTGGESIEEPAVIYDRDVQLPDEEAPEEAKSEAEIAEKAWFWHRPI